MCYSQEKIMIHSQDLMITRVAYVFMMKKERSVARQNESLIYESQTRTVSDGQSIELMTIYGNSQIRWVLRGHDDTRYLDIEIEHEHEKEQKWAYECNALYLGQIPESLVQAHYASCANGTLRTGQIADASIFGDQKIIKITKLNNGMNGYYMEGHWSDDALDKYPETMSAWVNSWPR